MVENDNEDMDYVVDLKPKKNNKKAKASAGIQTKNVVKRYWKKYFLIFFLPSRLKQSQMSQ